MLQQFQQYAIPRVQLHSVTIESHLICVDSIVIVLSKLDAKDMDIITRNEESKTAYTTMDILKHPISDVELKVQRPQRS